MLKIILSYSRIAIPLMLGICIGIGLSFMILPLLEESACELRRPESETTADQGEDNQIYKVKRSNSHLHPFLEGLDLDSFRSAEFEPKLVTTEQSGSKTAQKPVRNRFIRSELNMKDTLFVAYITSPEQLRRRATALNKTLENMREKIGYKFFANTKVGTAGIDLPIMALNLLEPLKLPVLTVKYLMNQFQDVNLYKYYLILPDTSYSNLDLLIKRLLEFKSSPFFGFAQKDSTGCDLSVGFVLSEESVRVIGENVDTCEDLFTGAKDSYEALGKCISTVTGQSCTVLTGQLGQPFYYNSVISGQDLSSVDVSQTVLFTDLTSSTDIYRLRRHFAKKELDETINNINNIRQEITDMYVLRPVEVPWDLTAHQPFHTVNRYDILRWTLITKNSTYLAYDYENGTPIKASTAALHDDIVSSAMAYLNAGEMGEMRYTLIKVLHAYSRSDPTRGQDFLLTVLLKDHVKDADIMKTFEMVKPRSGFQFMPFHYTPSTTPIHIVIPFIEEDMSELDTLVESFHENFGSKPQITMHIAFGSRKAGPEADIDEFETIRSYVTQIESDLGVHNRVNVLATSGGTVSMMDVLTEAIDSLPDDVIVVISTLTTDLSTEFISHVLTNTIKGKQAFAPIAFWEYTPNLIYHDKRRPDHVDVSRNIGHFGEKWYDHLSFFSCDYKSGISGKDGMFAEPIDVLTSIIGLEVFRAPDPNLLVRSYRPSCLTKSISDKTKCSMQFLDNMGSGPILAKSLLQGGFTDSTNNRH